MIKQLLLTSILFATLTHAFSQTKHPNRRAIMGAIVSAKDNHVIVDSIIAESTFDKLGVEHGDIVLKINSSVISTLDDYTQATSDIRTDDNIEVTIERNHVSITKSEKGIMRPYETNNFAEINYDWLPFHKGALRIITKKPQRKTNCPTILFIPGYNCSSIENFPNNYNGKLMNEWIKAGYAVVCVEKSGNGDSHDCTPCIEVDMKTDIELYSKAYEYMQQLNFSDKQNLFIWGHSMGGVIAPVLAEKYQPKGVIAFATVYRPWSEFLLEMHRIQSPLDGKSYTETENFVRGMHKIYYEFFVNKKSPQQLAAIPEYKTLAESELEYKLGNNQMWGRHWRFWQQIDSLNLAANWSKVNGKVLSIFGGADFIQCSELEQKLIVETVNQTHPDNATYLRIEDVDHLMVVNHSWKESSEHLKDKKYIDANFNYELSKKTIEWLNMVSKLSVD